MILRIFPALVLLVSTVTAKTTKVNHPEVGNAEVVAATLILEAGGERDSRAMSAVMEVIHNRAVKRGLTYEQVCLQRLQFSCWNGVKVSTGISKAKKHTKWGQALRIASSKVVTNYARGADHYHTLTVKPSWRLSFSQTAVIQNHIFYRS